MKSILWAVCLLALVRPAIDLSAQVNPYKDGTPGVSGYRSEVLAEVMIQQDKFLRLAEAVPADKYIWRPAPDVRSFAEVFLHVSAANYNIYKLVGAPPPAGVDVKGLEKSTTDKTKVIATLKDSFAHARKAITAMPDADLDKSLDWFGGKNTERGGSCLSSATPPSIWASRSPTLVSSEWFRRGPRTPRSSRNKNQKLRPRRSSNNLGT